MQKETKFIKVIDYIWRYSIIATVIIMFVVSLHMNYDANKRFDELWTYENMNYGIYKGFRFTPEAKAEPIWFYTWECVITKDEMFWQCNHCPIIGDCSYHEFGLYTLSPEQITHKKALQNEREQKQRKIIWSVIAMILMCFWYWAYLWKYQPDQWKQTLFAKWLKDAKKE